MNPDLPGDIVIAIDFHDAAIVIVRNIYPARDGVDSNGPGIYLGGNDRGNSVRNTVDNGNGIVSIVHDINYVRYRINSDGDRSICRNAGGFVGYTIDDRDGIAKIVSHVRTVRDYIDGYRIRQAAYRDSGCHVLCNGEC